MHKLIEKINSFKSTVNFESLGEFVKSLDYEDLNYNSFVTEPESIDDYGRNKFTNDPFECVLINWPAGVESAVHHHRGLFGYVWVLEGELENVFYNFKNNKLIAQSIDRYRKDDLCPEPDNVIHKLRNSSKTSRAITLHFYYPAIKSFEGMRIYNIENRKVGILSKQAKTAKWSLEDGHFKKLVENAFEYVPHKNTKL